MLGQRGRSHPARLVVVVALDFGHDLAADLQYPARRITFVSRHWAGFLEHKVQHAGELVGRHSESPRSPRFEAANRSGHDATSGLARLQHT